MENVNNIEIKKVELTHTEECWMKNLAFICKDKLEFLDALLKDENQKDFIERNFKEDRSLLIKWVNENSSMKKIIRGEVTLTFQVSSIDVEIEDETEIDDIDWESHAKEQMDTGYSDYDLVDSEVIDYVALDFSNTVQIENQKKVS